MMLAKSLPAYVQRESLVQAQPLEVWSIRPITAPSSSVTTLCSISALYGPKSISHGPAAVSTVVGQLQPLVHGRAGLPRQPPPPPPPLNGDTGHDGADDEEFQSLLQQRRLSHAAASTSNGATAKPGAGVTTAGSDLPFKAAAASPVWTRPRRRQELTTAQAAVHLLKIARAHVEPVRDQRTGPAVPNPQASEAVTATATNTATTVPAQGSAVAVSNGAQPGAVRHHQHPKGEAVSVQTIWPAAPSQPPRGVDADGASGDADGDVDGGTGGGGGGNVLLESLMTDLDLMALRQSLEVVRPLLPQLSVAQLQRCLEALAAVRHVPSDPWVMDLLTVSEPRLPDADATEVYGMLAAMRDLGIRPQRREWLERAVGALTKHLAQLAAPQVVDLLCCFADLALRPPELLLSRAFALLLPDLPQLQPADVLELLAGCSRMRCAPPPYVLAASYAALTPAALAAAPPGPLCRLAAAMAALRLQPPPGLLTALVSRADVVLRAEVEEIADIEARAGSPEAETLGTAAVEGRVERRGKELRPRRGGRRGPLGSAAAAAAALFPAASSFREQNGGGGGAFCPGAAGQVCRACLLAPTQLSCLLRDLRTLAAPVPADWGRWCGRYLVGRTGATTPVVHVLYMLGSIARCGLTLEPTVVRIVATRLTASLVAASAARRRRQRRNIDEQAQAQQGDGGTAAGPGCEVMEALLHGTEKAETEAEEEKKEEEEKELWHGSLGGGAGGLEGLEAAVESCEDASGQWTPQALSTAATALVPYAAVLPASLLRALYVNLYETLEQFDVPQLTATLHALPYLTSPTTVRHGHRSVAAAAPSSPLHAQNHPPPPPSALLSSYLSCLRGRMHRMQPWQLSMCLFALLRLRVRPDPPWMDAFLGQVYRTLPYTNEVQISSIAWVVAKLSYRPQVSWVERLLAAAAGRLSCFSPRHLCQLLWAVAAMGHQPADEWLARWLDKARGHFRTSDGRTLAALTWALATLGHSPGDQWLQDLCRHLERRLPYTPPRAVANTLAALATLGHRPNVEWLDAVTTHVRSRLGPPVGPPPPPARSTGGAAVAGAAASSGCYSLQDLAHVCNSLARLSYSPDDSWVEAVASAAAHLALLGPATGPNDADDDRDDAAVLLDGGVTAAAGTAAAAAHAKHIALLVLALARLRRQPPPAAWAALLDGLHPCLPYAAPQSLAVLLAAAAALRLPLPREHAGALLLTTHRRLPGFTGRGMAMVVRGFVELGIHPGLRWLGRLEEALLLRRQLQRELQQELQRDWLRQQQHQQRRRRQRRLVGAAQALEEGPGSEVKAMAEEEAYEAGVDQEEVDGWRPDSQSTLGSPPPLLLTPGERCSLLWAVTTLETARLAESEHPSLRQHVLPQGPQVRAAQAAARLVTWQQQQSRPALSAYPPPPRWARKPGSVRRPAQLAGLLALLLPAPETPLSLSSKAAPPDAYGTSGGVGGWRQLESYSSHDLALVCWSLGRLRARPSGLVRALLAEVRRRCAAVPAPPAAATTATARTVAASRLPASQASPAAFAWDPPAPAPGAGNIGGVAGQGVGGGGANGLEEVAEAEPAPSGFGPRALAMSFWGLSAVGVWPSVQWQAAAAAEALRQALEGALGPHHMSTILAALARWRRLPRRHRLRRRRQGLQIRVRTTATRAVTTTAAKAATAGVTAAKAARMTSDSGRAGVRNGSRPATGAAQQSPLVEGADGRAAVTHGSRQAGTAASGARGGWRRTVAAARLAGARLRECTAALAAVALTDSAARMPTSYSPAGAHAAGAIPVAVAATTPASAGACAEINAAGGGDGRYGGGPYDARSLATLAWALANLGVVSRLPDPWVAAFMPVSLRLLSDLPPSQRVTILDSLSRLGLRPGRAWMDRAEQVVLVGGLALASSHRGLDSALRRMAGPAAPSEGGRPRSADGNARLTATPGIG